MTRLINPLFLVACGAALIVFSLLGGCAPPNVLEIPDIGVEDQRGRAVQIGVRCGLTNPKDYTGTGVIMDNQHVMTAYHVIDCDGPYIVGVKVKGSWKRAWTSRIAPEVDLAVLRLDEPLEDAPAVNFTRPPGVGGRVCIATASPYPTRRCGQVESLDDGRVRHSIVVEPGNSGSGMYDRRGRLVGIVTHLRTCAGLQICGGVSTELWVNKWIVPERVYGSR